MKRVMLGILSIVITLLLSTSAYATGSCVYTSSEAIPVMKVDRVKTVTLTCTGDGSIAAFSFVPKTYGVKGWFLYSVTTDPGASAPTTLYDITLLVGGEDIAGGLLADRSATLTQTVLIAPPVLGYPVANGTIAITFTNNTANPSTIVMTLRFVAN